MRAPARTIAIFRRLLTASPRAKATGVEFTSPERLLRFHPDAERQLLLRDHASADRYRDLYVGVNMVGQEEDEKGYPLRFFPCCASCIQVSRHQPVDPHEQRDEPGYRVRDTLLLGAQRIGMASI